MTLNQVELQNLRHLISAHGTVANKLDAMSQQCQDNQISQMLASDAQDARQNKQKLMTYLH
ncbi:hypothetical protein [Clostridium sp. Marseille-P2415]|uniref:hypothetical protein n=1 Tax=Clostridium sp. Marseille-P2415 TaxID=1805471 RepID=UPI00098881FA|nr:hypothetical protein [Clostridium sp. Marseille-P2415]